MAHPSPSLPSGMVEQLGHMQTLQKQRALQRVNGVSDTCFNECVTDFSLTRNLGSQETACVQACVQKYLEFSNRVGQAFLTELAADARWNRP
mmetsp:Transcript_58775/g.131015  ORF Transcript_58775/g.131015 Transcript_58775/m.131015 type:complete len:92 (-) Transcript_58775:472-747(-)|eukprot:CAMPEP_0181213864 /NCGR_PEP_ID=MMETSP1096-20121128/25138_1 /TAXON_ID=156174 ORGANISM="Chrysochromulina ericina, Strain CCMP281" /NCGR_SAMPLE_ID=MMETSP1096 /ASSEMBLY_ACC=CAM_ASM_000453 /LENGTH=91 /DNA_ID=CAMNT_0023305543 /DNA_START=45 /DNA_END=320 /DNA_ORIENTATION=-